MERRLSISSIVSERLHRLRRSKELGVSEVASKAGLPVSSYACIERGYYKITLDNLFKVLSALDADITEVWPRAEEGTTVVPSETHLKRLQEFRLAEVITLSGGDGAALFKTTEGRVELIMSQSLPDSYLDRVRFYLEDGVSSAPGFWFRHRSGRQEFHFLLKSDQCPSYLAKLIEQYLIVWSVVFAKS